MFESKNMKLNHPVIDKNIIDFKKSTTESNPEPKRIPIEIDLKITISIEPVVRIGERYSSDHNEVGGLDIVPTFRLAAD